MPLISLKNILGTREPERNDVRSILMLVFFLFREISKKITPIRLISNLRHAPIISLLSVINGSFGSKQLKTHMIFFFFKKRSYCIQI